MINSLRARTISPIPDNKATINQDVKEKMMNQKLPRLQIIDKMGGPIATPKISDRRKNPMSASVDERDQLIGFLTRLKRQQLMQSDRNRSPTNSPSKKQDSKDETPTLRLYPGITEEGMRRLLNNTFIRINREQAQLKAQDARRRKEVLEKLSEYDEKPIQRILREKHMENVRNHYHDLDKVPDIQINELRVERLLRKLDKIALSPKFTKKDRSPQSVRAANDAFSLRLDRLNNERTFLTRSTLDESTRADRSLPLPDESLNTLLQRDGFEKTDFVNKKQRKPKKNTRSLKAEKLEAIARKRSASALPPVNLSAMNIVKEIFPTQPLESFIYDNFETTIRSNRHITKNRNQVLPIVLASKKSNALHESIDLSDRYGFNLISSTRGGRAGLNMSINRLTSKRGASPPSDKNNSSLEKEELSSIIQNYRNELKSFQRINKRYMKEVESYNDTLNNDHERLKSNAARVIPLNQNELIRELDAIRVVAIHGSKIKQRRDRVLEERKLNRSLLLGEKAPIDGLMKFEHQTASRDNQ